MRLDVPQLQAASRRSNVSNSAPQYRCLRCDPQRWRQGGVSMLGRHLAVHTGHTVDFPDYQLVDADGDVLSFDGDKLVVNRKPRRASKKVDGWVRHRPHIAYVGQPS